MIERIGQRIQIICDVCEKEHTEQYHSDDFNEMTHEARTDGWAIVKDGDDWSHICPNCNGPIKVV